MNKTTEALKLAEEALGRSQLYIDEYHPEWVQVRQENEGALAALVRAEALAEPVCRSDGRCQYAIDHGAEGLGHCPTGKCCMPVEPVKQEPVAWVNNESVQKLRECGWGDEAIATVVPTINLGAPVDAKAIQHCPCCGSDYFAGKTKVDLDTAVKSDPLYLQGRAEALEEAAAMSESRQWNDEFECAAAIRGLK